MFARLATPIAIGAIALAALSVSAPAIAALDDSAAMSLLKKNDCTKCHAMDKSKKGPSYKKISAKYKEDKHKVGAADKLMKHLTSSPKVKLDDGSEEDHKALELSKPVIGELVQWILDIKQ